jgi:hypothetical protein
VLALVKERPTTWLTSSAPAPRAATGTRQSARTGNADEAPAVVPRGCGGVGRSARASQADRPVSSNVQRYVTQNDDAQDRENCETETPCALGRDGYRNADGPMADTLCWAEGEGLKGCAARTGKPAVAP